jgi:hypothetical protein
VDGAYYADLAGRLYGLLIRLDDRLGREQVQLLHYFAEVGEYASGGSASCPGCSRPSSTPARSSP